MAGQEVTDLLIVGGGAAGLCCAVATARLGLGVTVLEKMDRCGHKLAITGGKKANFTHAEEPESMVGRFDAERRILLPLLRRFPFERVVGFFESLGIRSRTDADGCVWPVGVDAAGLRDRMVQEAERHGARFVPSCRVTSVEPAAGGWRALGNGGPWHCRNLCLATGGASFPQTGSTGDGIGLLAALGLPTTPWFPGLAALATEQDLSRLAGITHKQVNVGLADETGKAVRSADGHFIFCHGYVSGSAVMKLSGFAARRLVRGEKPVLVVDWVPGLTREELEAELVAARGERGRRLVANYLCRHGARRLADLLLGYARVPAGRTVAELTAEERRAVVAQVKGTRLVVTGTEPMERATVTGGGLALDEVDLATCEVRRHPGLYVVGELLDTWGETGGYNLHLAWSTGIAAAEATAGRKLAWSQT